MIGDLLQVAPVTLKIGGLPRPVSLLAHQCPYLVIEGKATKSRHWVIASNVTQKY